MHVPESGAWKKPAAGVGIREAREGYHQVAMATVSLASPSLTWLAPATGLLTRGL